MNTNSSRPVFLDLRVIRFPVGAVVSIFHRISGVLLVLALPAALFLFDLSLRGPAGFETARALLSSGPGRIGVLLAVALFGHHFFAGLRHLLMDIDIGVGLAAARLTAYGVFIADAVVVSTTGALLL
jgi:succinate dehydrogenase / fumarate reductase cytochrome b subunit